jgi:hypothetical protein
MIEVTDVIKIHDFRFEIKLEICPTSKSYDLLNIDVYFIGIDDFGVRLSEQGSDYLYHGYYDELSSAIEEIVNKYKG